MDALSTFYLTWGLFIFMMAMFVLLNPAFKIRYLFNLKKTLIRLTTSLLYFGLGFSTLGFLSYIHQFDFIITGIAGFSLLIGFVYLINQEPIMSLINNIILSKAFAFLMIFLSLLLFYFAQFNGGFLSKLISDLN